MDKKEEQDEKTDQNAKKPVKNAVDLQKLKLEKLFKNIERPVHLPEPPKKRGFSAAPEFVRNVMGSSAGAGSGEFHVYRHIRRRENARLKFIAEEAAKEDKDVAYQIKLEENRKASEQRTAKKRAKRQKKKARQQGKEKRPRLTAPPAAEQGDADSDSDGDDSERSEPEQEQEQRPKSGSALVDKERVPVAGSGDCDETGATSAAASDPAAREAGAATADAGADSSSGADDMGADSRLSPGPGASKVT